MSVKIALVVSAPTIICSKCGRKNKFPSGGVLFGEYVFASDLDDQSIKRIVKQESKNLVQGQPFTILLFKRQVRREL